MAMNDETTGQLTTDWRIPDYAQNNLWLDTEAESIRLVGEHGSFMLTMPAQRLILRWGSADGPALAVLRWQVDTLDWDGSVKIGGYVDALHLTELPDSRVPIGVVGVGGQPLHPTTVPYPTAAMRKSAVYTPPDYFAGVDETLDEASLMWLVGEDSPLLAMAENALLNKLRVWCFGQLADADGGWDDHFALPLLLESMTVFAP